jgi:hypothetical protein
VETGEGDIGGVAFESRNEGFGGVIPNLDRAVVGGGEDVGFVGGGIVVDMIDTYGAQSETFLVYISEWSEPFVSCASNVKFAFPPPPKLQILTVRSKHAEANVFVSLGLMAKLIT